MGHGKETPRQKMIGMMYLVLTALLALNVSKDILNAFVVVNNGLEVTNKNFKSKNESLYNDFATQMADPGKKIKVQPYFEASEQVKKEAQLVCDSIHELKRRLLIAVDGGDIDEAAGEANDKNADGRFTVEDKILDLMLVNAKDNYDIPTHMFCGTDVTGKGAAAERLKLTLISLKENFLKILESDKLEILNKKLVIENYKTSQFGIRTDDPGETGGDESSKYWETQNFYHLASVAVVTMLSKIENDVRNAEADVVSTLLAQIGALDFKFDKLEARVVAKSNYVISGGKYEADLFVAAFSTTDKPIVVVGSDLDTTTMEFRGDTTQVPVINGVAKYIVPAGGVGPKKYSAVIKVKKPSGEFQPYFIKDIEYMVAQPAAVVSPTKMNVFYIGVPNPVDISVSGFSADKIQASISSGSISKSSSGWIVSQTKSGKVNINVSVKMDDGTTKSMGSSEFRVKTLPNPVAKIADKSEGLIGKGELTAQQGVKAAMDNFDFDLKVTVKSFTVSATIKGFTKEEASSSNIFTPSQKAIIGQIERGQKVYFENIRAAMPDGTVRNLNTIAFKIN
ncbi:MAG TPA: hypothetical protein DDX39_02430 [Bacteroidales bacterium]|nr:MAG: hypothetical protein A2W98_03445 [Bacteroidetes bacterium GWF2_33_38]OFY67922.1 MAG: hypothetical protein A2265_03490 [Bacteroidetes bacterium RIFOXYA12_FULL_33_9]OFY85274.1 MAG: hypothetical protein A2236_11305 [Bacteroidetes bacterium RIFOXYA2_FULL_33_7]HBF87472.1 hypothetical protein [Bacteroidales bacterium]